VTGRPSVVSLFSGIGGLDVGLETAGFDLRACVEIDPVARRALEELYPKWRLFDEGDVYRINPADLRAFSGLKKRELTVLAGGPPCQPFSRARAWAGPPPGKSDPRAKTLRAFFRIAKEFEPRVLLLENVPGLLSAASGYLKAKIRELEKSSGSKYATSFLDISAESYGVPQRRRRLFVICVRDGTPVSLPQETHGDSNGLKPFTTAWDAIGELDFDSWPAELACQGKWADLLPSIPEGSNYLHHTARGRGEPLFGWRTRYWSFLLKLARDKPAWTLAAQPGPATGPFHWRNRMLSISEMAALQTMPLPRRLSLSIRDGRKLIGNAVPSALGELLGLQIRRVVLSENIARKNLSLIPSTRPVDKVAIRLGRIPRKFLKYRGDWPEHPGPGKGPGVRAMYDIGK